MIDQDRALKVVSKFMPHVPEEKLKAKIAEFAKAHPNLTDEQAFTAFVAAMQNPQAQKKIKSQMNVKTYLQNPLMGAK